MIIGIVKCLKKKMLLLLSAVVDSSVRAACLCRSLDPSRLLVEDRCDRQFVQKKRRRDAHPPRRRRRHRLRHYRAPTDAKGVAIGYIFFLVHFFKRLKKRKNRL